MIEIELLQVALGTRNGLSHIPNQIEWVAAHDFADKQGVTGLMLSGIERLATADEAVKESIQKVFLLQWIGEREYLKSLQVETVRKAKSLIEQFNKAGFRTCVLKGVGNTLFYDNMVRTPGDIDLWVMPDDEDSIARARRMTQDYVHSLYPEARGEFVHMDWPWNDTIPVEIHFTPSMDGNPMVDSLLQRFFEEHAASCFDNMSVLGFPVPTRVVNGVFLLHHLKRHFINEGIGLRHVVDYVLLLRSLTASECEEVWTLLERFNLQRFAKGVMYVISEVLGDRNVVDWPCDRRLGEYLLYEMLEGGNFGKYDGRKGNQRNFMQRWMWFGRMSLNRMRLFPRDAFWSFLMRLRIGVSNHIDK